MSNPSPTTAANESPRGFLYFCEERRQYLRGALAWAFWLPYLAGAATLEPKFAGASGDAGAWSAWLPLTAFLILFPPLWRAALQWFGSWRKSRAGLDVTRSLPVSPARR